MSPKIELHIHLEATVRPQRPLEIAARGTVLDVCRLSNLRTGAVACDEGTRTGLLELGESFDWEEL